MLLKGALILDCSILLPGPFVGKLLAKQGARVLKIENPNRPDPARKMVPFYKDLNSCKELVLIDTLTADGRAEFARLVQKADGLIEGFRPQAKKKLGFDEASLHAINPKLCIASIVGYPEDGPWRDRAGHDLNFSAVTGCVSLFNEMPSLPLADLFAAYQAALSLSSAIAGVARGAARGTRSVVSMSETLKDIQGGLIEEFRMSGVSPGPEGTLFSGRFPCYRLYQAKDGRRISVGAIEHKFWEKVCSILQLPEVLEEGYATGEKGLQTVAKIQARFESQNWSHWAPLFDSADCCVEPVLNYQEVYGV